MSFSGWSPDDYRIFEVPDFAERMGLIRSVIAPKLQSLAVGLEPFIGRTPIDLYPHVARHMRRRTNAPDETWVAFCRDKRAYKKYAHLMTGIGLYGAFSRLVVKVGGVDYNNLKQASRRTDQVVAAIETAHREAREAGYKIERYDGYGFVPITAEDLIDDWSDGGRDFVMGRRFYPEETLDGRIYLRKVSDTFEALMAFYQLGCGD